MTTCTRTFEMIDDWYGGFSPTCHGSDCSDLSPAAPLHCLMDTANTRVKVTLKAQQNKDGSKVEKPCSEFLGDYVFPPSSASLRMCCGKRVFERIYDGQV